MILMHKTTTALLAAGVFLAVLLTVTGATWLGNGRHFGPPAPQPRVEQAGTYSPAPRCKEDQPCWDCRTMGNRICGPTGAVCATDAECAQWDAAGYTMPRQDAGDVEPWCLVGTELYDTENPNLGEQGIVCRPLMEV